MGASENSTIPDTDRAIKSLPKRMSKSRSFFNDPQSEPPVAEGNTTPLSLAYIPPSSPSSLIFNHNLSGSEDVIIPDTVRIIKPLPKRTSNGLNFNDPGTHPPVVENFSPPTHISLSNPAPDHDIGGSKNQTLTTTKSYGSLDQDTCLSNVVELQTLAVAEGLTTLLAPPPVPSPLRPIANGIESFFATTPPHTSKALSDPGASTSMDNLSVPPTASAAASAKLSSSTPSKSVPSAPFSRNRSRSKLLQTSADASDDDAELKALIRRFSKSRIVWVDDDPDPIPVSQPIVPLQTSRLIDNNGVATPILDRAAGNIIVDLIEKTTDMESIGEVNHSEEVGALKQSFERSFLNKIHDFRFRNVTLICPVLLKFQMQY
jgi:hypothetical protein